MQDRRIILPMFFILFLCFIACRQTVAPDSGKEEEVDSQWVDSLQHIYQFGICTDSLDVTEYPIRTGDNPAAIFARAGFSPRMADSISNASAQVLDPTKLRAGMQYCLFTTADSSQTVRHIAFAKSLTDYAMIDLTGDTIRAYEFCKPITTKRNYIEGTLNSSLWNTLRASGVDPLLALRIHDIYAWQIDFFDIKDGDSFRVIYDMAYIDDTTALGIDAVRGAIFTHKGKEYEAVPFTQDSVLEFFDKEGSSLRKAFLKAPLDFIRITSRFTNSRFHPVLKRYRAHHGIDYAAPTGTPVKSIGAGTVIEKAYQGGGGGNYLKIRHNSAYSTTYMHLKGFAKGIQKGSSVQQGQVIGYVGSTGLSTGPHLDFRVYKNGQPINPQQMEAPPSVPIKPANVDSFTVVRHQVLAELDSFRLIQRPSPPTAESLAANGTDDVTESKL